MQQTEKQFRQDEIITMVHWDKALGGCANLKLTSKEVLC